MPETETRKRILRERDGVRMDAMIFSPPRMGEGGRTTIVLSPELVDEIIKARTENREEVGEFPLDEFSDEPRSIRIIIDSDN